MNQENNFNGVNPQPVNPQVPEQSVDQQVQPTISASPVNIVSEVPINPQSTIIPTNEDMPKVSVQQPVIQQAQFNQANNGVNVTTTSNIGSNGGNIGVNVFAGKQVNISKNIDFNNPKLIIGCIIAIVAIIALVFAIGSKTLTCTNVDEYMGLKITIVQKIKFKMDKAKSIYIKQTYDFNDFDYLDETDIDKYADSLEEELESNEELDDFKIKRNGNVITIEATFEAGNGEAGESFKVVKSDFEDEDYICK